MEQNEESMSSTSERDELRLNERPVNHSNANYLHKMTTEFKLDLHLAQHLGFLHFAVGGSRAYKQPNLKPSEECHRDWN